MLRKEFYRYRALSVALSLVIFVAPVAPALAAASPQSNEARLEQIENSLLQRTQKGMSEAERLSALETRVFGSAKAGSVSERLASLDTAVSAARQSSSLLAPPMAPRLDNSQWSKAEEAKPQALSNYDDPDSATSSDAATAMLKRATDLYSAGNTAEAERMFKKVLSLDSRNADAHYNLGAIAESRGDNAQALNEYRIASQLNPHDAELKDALAQIERKQNSERLAQAEQQRQKEEHNREAAHRDNLKSMIAQASTAYKNGQYDSAIRQLETVVKQAPNDSDVRFALAQAYKAKGDLSKARLNLNQAIASQPNNKLYRDALSDLEQRLASGSNHDSRGQSGQYDSAQADGGPAYAPSPRKKPVGDVYSTAGNSNYGNSYGSGASGYGDVADSSGDIQPFTPSPSYSSSASASRKYDRGGMRGLLGGGGGASSLVKRAALGSVTGAAMGAMWGRNSGGSMKSNMLKGALMGGMMGILTGGL